MKIPCVPVDDNTGALIPKYFRLWEHINRQLLYSERQTTRRRAKPESVLREAEGALAMLASECKKTFEDFRQAGSPVRPALIVVCDNTALSKVVHEHIAKGNILPELENPPPSPSLLPGKEVVGATLRIDTKLLQEAESAVEGETKGQMAERLRKTVDTIGKTEWEGEGDPPGKDIFPQVLNVVWEYLEQHVFFTEDTPLEEIALLKYRQFIIERLTEAIEPDTDAGEPPVLPVIERFRPIGSTSEVLFRTVRPTIGTAKSHISHVVLDAPIWEHSVAYQLERMPEVVSYARNDHLDFTIPYEWQGVRHEYRPDYLIRLRRRDGKEIKIILEVKGFESEKDRQKEAAANLWVRAVNHHGDFGRWAFRVCRDPL